MYAVGNRLILVGTWDTSPIPEGRIPIYLHPIDHSSDDGAIPFGYTHQTTLAILERLEQDIQTDNVVLDVGAGSGIVAIAAKLLGAKTVITTEQSKRSVNVAKENFKANKVQIDLHETDDLPSRLPAVDIAVVNLGSWSSSAKNSNAEPFVRRIPLKDTGKAIVTMNETEDVSDVWEIEDRRSLEPTRASFNRLMTRHVSPTNGLDLVILRRR